jgi:hypothetical protein
VPARKPKNVLAALPKPPFDDLFDDRVCKKTVKSYAGKLLKGCVIVDICQADLEDALARTWLLYLQGQDISVRIKFQQKDLLRPSLAKIDEKTGKIVILTGRDLAQMQADAKALNEDELAKAETEIAALKADLAKPRLPRLRLYKELAERRRDSRKQAKAAAKLLMPAPSNRPKQYGEHAFIQAMRIIWERHSPDGQRHPGWTASGYATGSGSNSKLGRDGKLRAEQEGPFQRFANEWLLTIDPGRPIPSRHIYDATKLRMQNQPT